MPEYDDTNRGVLFRNQQKKSDKSPDFSGKVNVNGTEYRLAGWFKEPRSGNGNKFISLSVSEADQEGSRQAAPAKSGSDTEW